MKNHNTAPLYKIICLLALAFIAANAQAKKPKAAESESSATLAETLAFIDKKLAAHFYAESTPDDSGVNWITESGELRHNSDCQGIKYLRTQRYRGETYVRTDEFSLTDMDPEGILTESTTGGGSVYLVTLGGRPKVFLSQAKQGKVIFRHGVDIVSFKLTDLEIAKRVAKAFKHAIKLCTGDYQKEPF